MPVLSIPQTFPKLIKVGTGCVAFATTVALLYYGRAFFIALILSGIFALILDPVVMLVMRFHLPRAAATPIVLGCSIVVLVLLGAIVWSQGSRLAEDLPTYTTRASEIIGRLDTQLDDLQQKTIQQVFPASLREQQAVIQQKPQEAMKARRRRAALPPPPPVALNSVPNRPPVQEVVVHQEPRPFLSKLYAYAAPYFDMLLMISFVPFLVYFMLSWRDGIGDRLQGLIRSEGGFLFGETWSGIGKLTRAYVLGNFLLWILLSGLSTIVFFVMGVPYWALAGPLSGFFSLMPYVGLPLSMLPPLLATLAVPNKFKVVLGVAVFTGVLHVVAANFLYAKIIGRRVRLNPLVVTISLMFWASLWGGIGLVLAVPITAAIKAVCDNVESLRPYGRLLGDEALGSSQRV